MQYFLSRWLFLRHFRFIKQKSRNFPTFYLIFIIFYRLIPSITLTVLSLFSILISPSYFLTYFLNAFLGITISFSVFLPAAFSSSSIEYTSWFFIAAACNFTFLACFAYSISFNKMAMLSSCLMFPL